MEPLGILKQTVELGLQINGALEKAGKNLEDCRWIGELLCTQSAIAERLRRAPEVKDDPLKRAAVAGLEGALQRASTVVAKCQRRSFLRRAFEAGDIADELRGVSNDVVLHLITVFVAIQMPQAQENNELGDSKDPHASLSDGVAESVSGENVIGQNGSSAITNKQTLSEVPGERGSYKLVISRSTKNMTPYAVTSFDVHPTKKWFVTGHQGGYFSIWDYQEQKCVKEVKVNIDKSSWSHGISQYIKETVPPHWVCSTKFIQEKWLAVGDGRGYIYIYTYTDTKLCEVKKFKAHDTSVDTLCVHSTEPYLFSASAYGNEIKLWDWSKNWEKIQEFDVGSVYPKGVLSLKFNPWDTNTFACVTDDERLMDGNINLSSSFTTRLKEAVLDADYLFTDSQQHLMVTTSTSASPNCEIRDLATGKVVHTLDVSGRKIRRVASHPTPVVVGVSDDGIIYFWDASTYSLVEKVQIPDSEPRDLELFTDINGLTRLVATFKTTIAIMEVNLPIANTSIETGSRNFG